MHTLHTAYIAAEKKPDACAGVIFSAFAARGTSARAWAISRGWAVRSVYTVIEQWLQHPKRRGRMPLGGVYQAIAKDLQAELGTDVVPLDDRNRPILERAA